MAIRRHHASDQVTCISCITNCIRCGSLVPRPPLIGFNLGRKVGWVTYTCKYREYVYTSEDGGDTSSTHILLGVFVSALSVTVYRNGRLSRTLDSPDPL